MPGEEKIIIIIKKNRFSHLSPELFLKGGAWGRSWAPPLCSGAVARLEPALGLNHSAGFGEDKWGLE